MYSQRFSGIYWDILGCMVYLCVFSSRVLCLSSFFCFVRTLVCVIHTCMHQVFAVCWLGWTLTPLEMLFCTSLLLWITSYISPIWFPKSSIIQPISRILFQTSPKKKQPFRLLYTCRCGISTGCRSPGNHLWVPVFYPDISWFSCH